LAAAGVDDDTKVHPAELKASDLHATESWWLAVQHTGSVSCAFAPCDAACPTFSYCALRAVHLPVVLCVCSAEKLRGVFEALLANPASRSLMRQLLKGAGMPFNEEAFEEQVKVGGGKGAFGRRTQD
jgi:hypothetical protein